VQEGIDELTGMAARAGPPEIPDNLGNFRPDTEEQPQARRPAKVVRRREPTHLATVAEDEAATSAQQRLNGELDEVAQPVDEEIEPVTAAAPAADDDQGDDDGEDDPRTQELLRRLDAYEHKDLARHAQLNAVLARLGGGAAPLGGLPPGAAPLGGPGAADPRLGALTERIKRLPFRIDETVAANLGLNPQGAQTLEAMLTVLRTDILSTMAEAYTLDQEHARAQQSAAGDQDRLMQTVTRAFYEANGDLAPYGKIVNQTSLELVAQYPHLRSQPADWIRHTAATVRQQLQAWNVPLRRTVGAPAAGIGPGAAPSGVARIRPAAADFGSTSRGLGRGALSPLQKEMLDLARSA